MTSAAQAEASRKNGAMSCGPVSPEGKERSSRNAMRHGLTGDKFTILGEEEAEFEAYRLEFLASLAPADALEGSLAERIVQLNWRLRRAAWMEADLISSTQWVAHRKATKDEAQEVKQKWRPPPSEIMGGTLYNSLSGPNCPYDTLGRYERRLERGLFQAIRELRELRRERERREASAGSHVRPWRDSPRRTSSSPPEAWPPEEACPANAAGGAEAPPQAMSEPVAQAATAPASQVVAEAAGHVMPAGTSDLQRIHPASLAYIEEMERSSDATLMRMAVSIREELGLPPARKD